MTETITYIQNSLKDSYPIQEISSFIRLIMEHVCGLQPHNILLCKDKDLSDTEICQIKEITNRLQQSEPIQYILGKAFFYGLSFTVNPAVLIPRPETEELIELILTKHKNDKLHILDIGTGSGCIAISLAKQLNQSEVIGIDISGQALETAQLNAQQLNAPVTFIQTDILLSHKAEKDISGTFDIIVSNPPYVMDCEKAVMEQNVLQFEPHQALFVPDNDPLLFYQSIAAFGKKKLKKEGTLYFEINAQCGNSMIELLTESGYKEVELIRDLSGKDRIIKAIR